MAIQISSLTRVIKPVVTPKPLFMESVLVMMANPPSRAPSCMGEKKNTLAKREEKA